MALLQNLQQRAKNVRPTVPNIPPADHMAIGQEVDALYAAVRKSSNPSAKRATAALDKFLTDLSETPGRKSIAILSGYNDMIARWLSAGILRDCIGRQL
jgi:hypothetical protein